VIVGQRSQDNMEENSFLIPKCAGINKVGVSQTMQTKNAH
jgi:hypothetical protein